MFSGSVWPEGCPALVRLVQQQQHNNDSLEIARETKSPRRFEAGACSCASCTSAETLPVGFGGDSVGEVGGIVHFVHLDFGAGAAPSYVHSLTRYRLPRGVTMSG